MRLQSLQMSHMFTVDRIRLGIRQANERILSPSLCYRAARLELGESRGSQCGS